MNTDESLKVHMKARIDDPSMNALIVTIARNLAEGIIDKMPEEFDDIFSMIVTTRPSGTKYTTVDFI